MFVLAALAVSSQIGVSDDGYHPFSEPMEFDPDWQFFAPVQLQDMQDLTARQRANNGFYVTYDRLSIGVNRSTTEAASFAIDYTWGNRYDFGWMNSKESGWNFSAMDVGGPNVYETVRQQRLNQFVATDEGGNGPTGGTNGQGPPGSGLIGPSEGGPFITWLRENDKDGERVYDLQNSVNVGSFSSFEANKTWRMEPYRYGGILEPMIGLRYANFADTAHNDTYNAFPIFDGALPPAIIGNGETLLQDNVQTDNHMVLGQIGFRYTKFINRWTLSNDMKFFGGQVYQNQQTSRIVSTALYEDPVTAGDPPLSDNDHSGSTFSGRKNEESTWGFDLRVEGAYKATKYLDLRGGFGMIYFGNGIWRGSTITSQGPQFLQNQSVIMPAFTFGIALNR
jgi:hypothetical protein